MQLLFVFYILLDGVERKTHNGRTIVIFAINGYWVVDRTMDFYACRYELENDATQFQRLDRSLNCESSCEAREIYLFVRCIFYIVHIEILSTRRRSKILFKKIPL